MTASSRDPHPVLPDNAVFAVWKAVNDSHEGAWDVAILFKTAAFSPTIHAHVMNGYHCQSAPRRYRHLLG